MNKARFEDALKRVRSLPEQPPHVLLQLYGLYKQASTGDVKGKKPGRLNIKARAKYEAWASCAGMSTDEAMSAYVQLVDDLFKRSR